MKKETAPARKKKAGPYPNDLLTVLIAFAISIYILWPFPNAPFSELIKYRWFWYSFLVFFTISMAQVWLVSVISKWLDNKYNWGNRFYHRVLGQLLVGWIIPVAVSALMSWFWFQYLQADTHSIRYAYNRYMFKAIMDIALILNLVYLACSIGWFLKEKLKQETKEQGAPVFADHLYLQVPGGKEEIKVQISEIAYLYHTGKGTLLRAHDGRTFIFWKSLDVLERQLDPNHFFRASRTYIITRKAVRSWQRHTDRGMFLEVQPQSEKPVKISRNKAAEIVVWLKTKYAITNALF